VAARIFLHHSINHFLFGALGEAVNHSVGRLGKNMGAFSRMRSLFFGTQPVSRERSMLRLCLLGPGPGRNFCQAALICRISVWDPRLSRNRQIVVSKHQRSSKFLVRANYVIKPHLGLRTGPRVDAAPLRSSGRCGTVFIGLALGLAVGPSVVLNDRFVAAFWGTVAVSGVSPRLDKISAALVPLAGR